MEESQRRDRLETQKKRWRCRRASPCGVLVHFLSDSPILSRFLTFFAILCCCLPGWSQTVKSGPRVSPAVKFDTSAPLRQLKPAPHPTIAEPEPRLLVPVPKVPQTNQPVTMDPVLQSTRGPRLNIPATSMNFDGIGNGPLYTVHAAPPDTNMAVGPNHLVQIVNTALAVYNKTGSLLYGPVAINTLWAGFGGLCEADNNGDPIVRYDAIANRFLVSQF